MRCPHGMPSRPSCVECMEDGAVAKPLKWEPSGHPFDAKHGDVTCPGCYGDINVGQRIRAWEKGSNTKYTHVNCPPPA